MGKLNKIHMSNEFAQLLSIRKFEHRLWFTIACDARRVELYDYISETVICVLEYRKHHFKIKHYKRYIRLVDEMQQIFDLQIDELERDLSIDEYDLLLLANYQS